MGRIFVVLLAGGLAPSALADQSMAAIAVYSFALLYFCVVRRAIDPAFLRTGRFTTISGGGFRRRAPPASYPGTP